MVACAQRAFDDGPLVVTGAVATGAGLLGSGLRAALADALGTVPVIVREASVGAAALALRALPEVDADVADGLVRAGWSRAV